MSLSGATYFTVMPGDRINSNSKITTAAGSTKVQNHNPLTILTKKLKDYVRDQSQQNKKERVKVNKIEGGEIIQLREDELRYFFRVVHGKTGSGVTRSLLSGF